MNQVDTVQDWLYPGCRFTEADGLVDRFAANAAEDDRKFWNSLFVSRLNSDRFYRLDNLTEKDAAALGLSRSENVESDGERVYSDGGQTSMHFFKGGLESLTIRNGSMVTISRAEHAGIHLPSSVKSLEREFGKANAVLAANRNSSSP